MEPLISCHECLGLTWHLISMLKKSSLGSWWSPSPTRCPRLLWVILKPGRLPTFTRWSSRRRLWELAIKSNSSSVWGEVVIAGSARKQGEESNKFSNISHLFKKLEKVSTPKLGAPIISFRDATEFAAPSPLSPFCGSSRWQRWSSMRLLWNLLRRSKKQSSSEGSRPSFCKDNATLVKRSSVEFLPVASCFDGFHYAFTLLHIPATICPCIFSNRL